MDLTDRQIKAVLKGCRLNNREAQKELYSNFFSYAMSVAFRYSRDHDKAVEITNNAFLKIYIDLKNCLPGMDNTVGSFKTWLSNTVFDTCIEHKNKCSVKELIQSTETGLVA